MVENSGPPIDPSNLRPLLMLDVAHQMMLQPDWPYRAATVVLESHAGEAGRFSFYGANHPEKQAKMADDLGVALQITNILRDVREDFRNNRIYLPAEDLTRFGIEFAPFGEPEPFPSEAMQARFATLVEFEAARAREWYGSGLRLLATIDRRSAACTGAMAGIYRRLLERIARNPHAVLEGRMSLPGGEKALVAAEALAGLDRWKYRDGAGR